MKMKYHAYRVHKKTFDVFDVGDIFNNQEVIDGIYHAERDSYLLITISEKNDEEA